MLDFSVGILATFGFTDVQDRAVGARPEEPGQVRRQRRGLGQAEASLVKALEARGLAYERMEGEAVFYGPKIDIKIKDAIGREWQCTTIQFDFNLPERFDMTYVGEDGKEHRPYMVHRALLGSLERFFGVLIEHYDGSFPLWLAPVQVVVLPIAERHEDYAQALDGSSRAAGLRSASTSAGRRSARRSARPKSRRSRSSWSSATRRSSAARPPSASTARATRARSPSPVHRAERRVRSA